LPEEYEKCLIGLTAILREARNTSQRTEDSREKIQVLSLAKDCCSIKLELHMNATVIKDAIRFTNESQSRLTFFKKEGDKQPKEPDYDNSKDQLEEEQEEEAGEIATTTNHVF
jgi:hypothetical protein